jgi:hypothetical protein
VELEQQIDLRVSLSTISVLLVPLLRQAIFSVPDEEVLYGRLGSESECNDWLLVKCPNFMQ